MKHSKQKRSKPSKKTIRSAEGVWLYGMHACLAALANQKRHCKRLLMLKKVAQNLQPKSIARENITPEIVSAQDIEQVLPYEAVHQGIALLVLPLPPFQLEDFFSHSAEGATFLLLDQITDPHNVGAILRSALAFGVTATIMMRHNAPPMTGTLAKSASGALEDMPIILVTNLVDAMTTLKEQGFWCYGLDEEGAVLPSLSKTGDKIALVLGAEGRGLRPLTKKTCDLLLSIPTTDHFSTLNVSNAAAVALYALTSTKPAPDDRGKSS